MKALILAAGLGSRLAPITNTCPKCMVEVNGIPIIKKQIDNLIENGINDITVVAGYLYEVLNEFLSNNYPNVVVINNKDYQTTNNMYSAFIGGQNVKDDDFIMMNADVFYDSSVLKELINCSSKDAIVVDIGSYNEESMKVIEKNGKIVEISKQISKEDALGSSIDVYKFSKECGQIFLNKCEEYIKTNDLKKWSEVALNDVLQDVDFTACPLVGRWYEIDNFDDLQEASKLFKNDINSNIKTK